MNARTTPCPALFTRTALLLGLLLSSAMGWAQVNHVVISQVYGGGGNTSAPYNRDYVELFNPTGASVSVVGWSVQYASTAGTTWSNTGALTGSIAAGKYYLVQMTLTGTTGAALPTPNFTVGTAIDMSATNGKVALMNTATLITSGTSCPSGGALVDFVGFGTANCFEGTAATPAGSNTTSVTRKLAGCQDNNANNSDFTASAPNPRNSSTTAVYCYPITFAVTGVTPSSPTVGVGFSVTVEARDAGGNLNPVIAATGFTLSNTGGGTIGGTTSGSIGIGSSSVIVSGITLTTAGSATITATRTSGDNLAAGTSASFTVQAASGPDCLGVVGGTALPGTTCNDNNACTINDVWSAGCVCGGTIQDTDGDGVCDANDNCPNIAGQQGTSCNDNDACTLNDVLNTSCVCTGTLDNTDSDNDGVPNCADGCPLDGSKITPGVCGCGVLEVGNVCDDNNACTINDVYVSCGVCAGTSPNAYWNMTTAANATNAIPNASMSSISRGNNNGTTTLITTTSASSTSDYASASAGGNAGAAALTGPLNPATNAYFEFTVTPSAGFGFTLNGISFGSRSTSTGPAAYTLRSSADGYSANVATGTLNTTGGYLFKTNTGLSVSSSGSSAITFRLFGHSGTGSPSAGTANWRIDDLTINGCTVLLPTYIYTVARSGAGSGTVTSAPAGITCGTLCDGVFALGTVLTLTATPDAGSVFTGWSGGGCTGTGTCVSTVSAPVTVTATFALDSDGDGLADGSDPCQATAAVTGSPLFNAASCGANPGAFLSFSTVNGLQVASAISTCPAGSYCTGGTAPSALCLAGTYSSSTGQSTCASCMPGSYSAVDGATFCASCPQGQFSAVMAATTCTSCSAGTYNPNTGAVECLTCNGVTNTPTGATSCAPDSDGDGIADASDPCQATAAVTGSPLFNAATCGANPGAYLDFSTINGLQVATAVTTCPAGSYCTGGTAPPALCPAGKFSDVTGSSVCQDCAAGFYSSTTGATQCTACAAGSFSDVQGATECTACAAGSFSSVTGSTTCTSCGAGTYNPVMGATQCLTCSGQTNTPTGATSCTVFYSFTVTNTGGVASGVITSTPAGINCPGDCNEDFAEGTQVTLHAMPTAHHVFTGWSGGACSGTGDCVVTMTQAYSVTGTFEPDSDDDGIPDAMDDCQATSTVTGSPLFNAATCGANPGAYLVFTDVSGVQVATDLFHCPAGTYCPGGVSPAILCPAGRFSDVTGASVCQSCAAGSFSSSEGATQCTACDAGKFSNTIGATECLSCASGTYNPFTGQTECLSCTGGTDATTAATVCLDYPGSPYCPVGTATPTLSGGAPGPIFTCSNGQCSSLVLNPTTGEVDLAASAPGTYQVCASGACVELVIHPPAVLDPPTVSQTGGTNPTCSSSPVEFHATGTYSDGSSYDSDVSYVWSPGGITINGNGFFAMTTPVSGDVSVSVTSARVCASNEQPVFSSNTINLVVFPSLTIVPASLHIEQSLGSASTCSGSAMEFHLTGLYSDGSSATNDLSATWTDGVITLSGHNFGFSADASSSAVSASSVTSSRSCVSNSGSVAPPPDFALSVTQSVSLSSASLALSSGTNPTCSGSPRAYTAFGTFTDGSTTDSRPPGETQYDFYLNGALVQSSSNPLYQDNGQQSNPLFARVTSTRPCLSGSTSFDSPPVNLQVTATVDYAIDSDNDGYSVSGSTVSVCTDPGAPYRPVSVLVADGDCDDGDASVHPGATEVCDGVDQDCDSFVDEGGNLFYRDADGDTYGDASVSVSLVCTSPPTGFVSNSGDCDDTRFHVNQAAPEICDGRDDDCDGAIPSTETDDDSDGYVECAFSSSTWDGSVLVFGGDDCDDSRADVHPNAAEVCDPSDVDEDCDGLVNEGSNVWYEDADGDGYGSSSTISSVCTSPPVGYADNADDCDDTDADRHPGASEVCDGADQDCDGAVDEGTNLFYADSDGDTYGDDGVTVSLVCTSPPTGFVSAGGDCDDTDNTVFPGATEVCNSKDDDCDGTTDELDYTFYLDADSDGDGAYGGTFTVTVTTSCTAPPPPPTGYASTHTDCDDGDATVHAGAPELCDGKDNDCSGSISSNETDDDNDTFVECTFTGATWPVGSLVTGGDDCDDADATVYPGAAELCDSRDNDCDGTTDEHDYTFYLDADSDGDGAYEGTFTVTVTASCTAPPQPPTGYASTHTDCDDTRASVHPGAPEGCDGLDDDCDGAIPSTETDDDGDGYVECAFSSSTWDGSVLVFGGYDCDDSRADVHPNAAEVCDPSDVDEDCDGLVNEGSNVWYADADGDGFGSSSTISSVCTSPPTGYADNADDCDDTDADRHPGASEVCDNVDQDCDSFVDEGSNVFFHDGDGDGFGDASVTVSLVCTAPPSGYVTNDQDCDDSDADRHPGATEICDGVDQDCDNTADDADVGGYLFYRDADGDTYGDASVTVSLVCTSPPTGFVSNHDDCDDTDASVHPNGTETCDSQDEDCDGFVDEGSNVYFHDGDDDGFGDASVSVSLVCTAPPSGYVSNSGDCDDTDVSRHPGANEVCDNVDQDCDGAVDEGSNVYFHDGDDDGFGDASVSVSLVCTTPPSGYVSDDTDCDDTDADRHPGASEVCDGVDQDCDGAVDEGTNLFYADSDGDTYGNPLVSVSLVCTTPPSGYVSNHDDCDDAHLLYADTDGDGIGAGAPVACGVQSNTDNCPSVQGVVGSFCDDGNTATTGDVLNSACVCVGTPTCVTNPVVLSITTDANAAQIHWYLMYTGTNTPVCDGNGLASSSTIALNCCLPNGCYDLVVTDDFGDGINPGGYVLRDGTGKRIIDNAGNGASFTTLSLSPLGFCVPLGADAMQPTSCDVENATLTSVLQAQLNSAVTAQYGVHNTNSGYQFWVTNPNGGYSRRLTLTHTSPGTGAPVGTPAAQKASYFAISSMNGSSPLIPQGILLNIRVRSEVNGVFGNFGPACRLIIPTPTCATTQLTTTASPTISCGATGLTFSSVIWANSVLGATGYQFEFSKPGYTRRILSSSRSQALSFVTAPLQMNNCYQVRVRISYDNSATYCPFGPYCNITLGTASCNSGMALEGSGEETVIAQEARLSIWPNPNDGSIVNLSLTDFDPSVNTVAMDVTDIYGKLVTTRTIPVQDGYLNTTVDFEHQLAPGLYLMNMTVGERRYTERLVIQ